MIKKRKKWKKWILIVLLLLFIASGIVSLVVSLTCSTKSDLIYYDSLEEAVINWGAEFKSIDNERFSHVFSKKIDGKRVYFVKRIYEGEHKNTYLGSFSSYYIYGFYCLFTPNRMEATIHTHPYKNPVFKYSNTSTTDILGLIIPGNRKGYVVFPDGEVARYFLNGEIEVINP